ncbi:hypothetical protein VMCG_09237 [Cytospora schulzeri]|uniref:Uncharacterized protein n=1 Tax=Cytospora schulzeri TaxID=448051 RepID=A0A423VL03_9PEZI|nr:hypothetical protein VMCG_09237 [Valsa malicola]
MSNRKPDIRLVASNTPGRGLEGLGKSIVPDSSQRNGSPDDPRIDRSSSRSSSPSPGSSFNSSISSDDESGHDTEAEDLMRTPSFYKSAQWTADGTTVITSSYHDQICSFVVPSDLLEPREEPLTLRPQGVLNLATSTNVVAPAPYFDLLNPHTHHVLVACHDHPIQIFQALPTTNHNTTNDARHKSTQGGSSASSLYSYRLISPQTEAYLPVHSLVWPGSHMSTSFFVGTTNLIAQFDLHRIGEGPRQRVHTIPSKRHISKGNGVGMRGTVSALSMQTDESSVPTGLLAGGTWTRWVGLYDFARGGERTATWGIAQAAESAVVVDPPPPPSQPGFSSFSGEQPPSPVIPTHRINSRGRSPIKGIGGEGINQTAWSPDGRYLLINERQSTGVLVYDVRVTGRLLGFLAGRDALTHQRMDLTVYPGSDGGGGFEVWAGTRDGTVKVWQGVGETEGVTTLSSAGSTMSRSVWRHDNKRIEESSLKLWTIGASTYDSAVNTPEREATEMDTSQVDMSEVDTTQMETSHGVQYDVSWNDASQVDRGYSASQKEAETVQDDALQNAILQTSTPEKR